MKKAYICGAMTGLPLENFPAFDAAAARFRAAGWEVLSPAELSRQLRAANPDREIPTNGYRDFIPLDIAAIATCDALALLPGWEKSRGVKLELHAAELFGLEILDAETLRPLVGEVEEIGTPEERAEIEVALDEGRDGDAENLLIEMLDREDSAYADSPAAAPGSGREG